MLRNEWVPVRPDVWNDKFDCTVSVALGQVEIKTNRLMPTSLQMLSVCRGSNEGWSKPIVTEQNMYNLGSFIGEGNGLPERE